MGWKSILPCRVSSCRRCNNSKNFGRKHRTWKYTHVNKLFALRIAYGEDFNKLLSIDISHTPRFIWAAYSKNYSNSHTKGTQQMLRLLWTNYINLTYIRKAIASRLSAYFISEVIIIIISPKDYADFGLSRLPITLPQRPLV